MKDENLNFYVNPLLIDERVDIPSERGILGIDETYEYLYRTLNLKI